MGLGRGKHSVARMGFFLHRTRWDQSEQTRFLNPPVNRTICVMLYEEGRHKPFQVLQNDAARAPRCFLRQSLVAYQGVSVYGPKQANIVRSVVLAKFLSLQEIFAEVLRYLRY